MAQSAEPLTVVDVEVDVEVVLAVLLVSVEVPELPDADAAFTRLSINPWAVYSGVPDDAPLMLAITEASFDNVAAATANAPDWFSAGATEP